MAAGAGDAFLFEDAFTINDVNQTKYDRVARIFATSIDRKTTMSLDINTELFPCQINDGLDIVIASSLSRDGSKEDEKGWRDVEKAAQGAEPSLADDYEYVCHGKIYKFEDSGDEGQTM
jgi:DNA-directed RNA polymerases I, II, and III subunit RPABC3